MVAHRKRLLLAGLIGGALLLYGRGAFRWAQLRAQQARLEAEIVGLKAENQRLVEEARRLREDPDYAEAVARRQLGFVRPGETVIKIKSPKK